MNCAVFALKFNLTLIVPNFCRSFDCGACKDETVFENLFQVNYFLGRMDKLGLKVAFQEDVADLVAAESTSIDLLFDEMDTAKDSPNNLKTFDEFLDRVVSIYRANTPHNRTLLNFGYPWYKIRGDESEAFQKLYTYLFHSLQPLNVFKNIFRNGYETLKHEDALVVSLHIQSHKWYLKADQTPDNVDIDEVLELTLPTEIHDKQVVVYQFGTGRIPCNALKSRRVRACYDHRVFEFPSDGTHWYLADLDYQTALKSDVFVQTSSSSMMDAWLIFERYHANKPSCKLGHVHNHYGFPVQSTVEQFEKYNRCYFQ
jgi:hypothetical protein